MASKTLLALMLAICFQIVAGSYAITCDTDKQFILAGHLLRVNCKTKSGRWQVSELDLGLCYTNGNGIMFAKDNGHFEQSCRDCQVTGNHRLAFVCNCPKDIGSFQFTGINLDHMIHNWDGAICCYSHCGRKVGASGPPTNKPGPAVPDEDASGTTELPPGVTIEPTPDPGEEQPTATTLTTVTTKPQAAA